MHCRLAVADHSSPKGEQVEVQRWLVELVDWLFDPVPVDQSAHRVKRMGADPTGDFEVDGIVDVVGL